MGGCPVVKCPNLTLFSGSWVQYRSTPLEGTLGAWSKPSTSSADTRSGPWTWAMRKVLIVLFYDYVLSWIKAFPHLLFARRRLHPWLSGIWGKPSHCAGAGNLLWLLHGAHCQAAPPPRQTHHSRIKPRLCCYCSSSHRLGRIRGKGKAACFKTQKQPFTQCAQVRWSLQFASSSYRSS